jgi:hypothetical protein
VKSMFLLRGLELLRTDGRETLPVRSPLKRLTLNNFVVERNVVRAADGQNKAEIERDESDYRPPVSLHSRYSSCMY